MLGRPSSSATVAAAIAILAVISLPVSVPPAAATTAATGPTRSASNAWAPSTAPLLPSDARLQLTATLRGPAGSDLGAFDRSLLTGGGLAQGPFLSEAQFEARFSPSAAALGTVEADLARGGATAFVPTPDRLGLSFEVRAGQLPRLFGIHERVVGHVGGGPVFSPDGPPKLGSALAALVVGMSGWSNVDNAQLSWHGAPFLRPAGEPPRPGMQYVTVPGRTEQYFVGSDLAQLYGTSALFASGGRPGGRFAQGEAVATLLTGGYNLSASADLPPFDLAAVEQYFADTFPASWPQPTVHAVPVTLGGIVPPGPGGSGGRGDDSFAQSENSLDLEMAGSQAPGASIYNFYFAASALTGIPVGDYTGVADDFASELSRALSYDYGSDRLVAVSNSYGLPDLNDTLWNLELQHAAALGVTVVAASGDQGDAPSSVTGRSEGPGPIWPASAAFDDAGVLAVGGTALTASGTPNGSIDPTAPRPPVPFDPGVGGIAAEVAWYDPKVTSSHVAGSEGGVSQTIPEPSWQRFSAAQPSIVNATIAAQASHLGRAVPDVALAATGILAYVAAPSGTLVVQPLEGTSAAAPTMAGMLAESAAVVGHPFGYVDPFWYRLGSYASTVSSDGSPFRDVTSGSNYLYSAGPGWDPVTGWGSWRADGAVSALTNSSRLGYNYTGPSPGLPPGYVPGGGAPVRGIPPLLLGAVFAGLAIGVSVAIFATIRAESPQVSAPPPAAWGYPSYPPRPPSEHPRCARCGRERPGWLIVCPWCGAGTN